MLLRRKLWKKKIVINIFVIKNVNIFHVMISQLITLIVCFVFARYMSLVIVEEHIRWLSWKMVKKLKVVLIVLFLIGKKIMITLWKYSQNTGFEKILIWAPTYVPVLYQINFEEFILHRTNLHRTRISHRDHQLHQYYY